MSNVIPILPAEGDPFTLFGLTGTVVAVEPHSDWFWSVAVDVMMEYGTETMYLQVPTDQRTD